jgi:hypothetical protein
LQGAPHDLAAGAFGGFVALYGVAESVTLIEKGLAGGLVQAA